MQKEQLQKKIDELTQQLADVTAPRYMQEAAEAFAFQKLCQHLQQRLDARRAGERVLHDANALAAALDAVPQLIRGVDVDRQRCRVHLVHVAIRVVGIHVQVADVALALERLHTLGRAQTSRRRLRRHRRLHDVSRRRHR